MSIPIFLETDALYVVDKPFGWLTTPARLADDPRPCLGRSLQTQVGHQIYPVHRLDFEVSGLTLWAKSPDAHREAQEWFERSRVHKLYEAFSAIGPGPAEWVEWRSKLARGKKRAFVAPHGKPSVTLARQVLREESLFKWELVAVTGRPHQLRFEMSAHGWPIYGDVLYGGVGAGVGAGFGAGLGTGMGSGSRGGASVSAGWIGLRAVELDLSALSEGDRLGLPAICRVEGSRLPI